SHPRPPDLDPAVGAVDVAEAGAADGPARGAVDRGEGERGPGPRRRERVLDEAPHVLWRADEGVGPAPDLLVQADLAETGVVLHRQGFQADVPSLERDGFDSHAWFLRWTPWRETPRAV